MSERAQGLLCEALMLPHDERADVAAELLASLDDMASEDPAAVQAALWYEQQRIGLANEFLEAVDAALELIARFPQAGAPVPDVPEELLLELNLLFLQARMARNSKADDRMASNSPRKFRH